MSLAPRVIVGVSGASGAPFAVRIVELLAEFGAEIHLVVSSAAERTLAHEVGADALAHIAALSARRHPIGDIGAGIASGSFRTEGMIVAPCSMRTLSAVAASAADNLLIRAADVQLKERRPLILMARETPLHLGHIRNMAQAVEMGAIIAPPVPAFHRKPETIRQLVEHCARRAIGHLGGAFCAVSAGEWTGEQEARGSP